MKEVKTFQQMYRDGHVNRREFLAAMGALGITATTAGGLLGSASALAATPNRGGSVVFASNLHGPDDTLVPLLGTSTVCLVYTSDAADASSRGDLGARWALSIKHVCRTCISHSPVTA